MDKNRELHELLGLCWHETKADTPWKCSKCGMGMSLVVYPDYAADPRLVLREMRKRDDWIDFQNWCFVGVTELDGNVCYGVPIDLALDTTGKLRDMAIEYLKGATHAPTTTVPEPETPETV